MKPDLYYERILEIREVRPLFCDYLADTLHWNEYLVTGINMALNFVTEYLFQRYVVYGDSVDTQK